MGQLFEYKDIDRRFYEEKIADHLPSSFIDIHTHVWLTKHNEGREDGGRTVTWPSLVAAENPIEDLDETYRILFPGKRVIPLIFSSFLSRSEKFSVGNGYIDTVAKTANYPALLYGRPDWSSEVFEAELLKGTFCGTKVYLSLSDPSISRNNISIFDFLPHHQLAILNRYKKMVMLHVPRDKRIRDPLNVAQILTIAEKYPDVKVVIAHAGRAYCTEDIGNAFTELAKAPELLFDISANTNCDVFIKLLEAVGPKRVLFGSDLPITRLRMKRICENGKYINLVGKGTYGDVSADPNMREVSANEAEKHTFFLYEEIAAVLNAASKCGLDKSDIESIFSSCSRTLLARCGYKQ
ncbi:MAG: amidohydrolase family protein [Fibrobacteres bacterium]|nr:amidohydrolase family protein [Fibrobacterota bacterium]